MIPENLMSAIRGRISASALTALRAATANYDDANRHLRLDFFFAGTSENVDFEELEFGLVGEIIGDLWAGIDTVGFAVFLMSIGRSRRCKSGSPLSDLNGSFPPISGHPATRRRRASRQSAYGARQPAWE